MSYKRSFFSSISLKTDYRRTRIFFLFLFSFFFIFLSRWILTPVTPIEDTTCIHTYIYAYIHLRTLRGPGLWVRLRTTFQTTPYAHTHTHKHACTHTHAQARMYTHGRTFTHRRIYVHTDIRTNAHLHARTNTLAHTYTHISVWVFITGSKNPAHLTMSSRQSRSIASVGAIEREQWDDFRASRRSITIDDRNILTYPHCRPHAGKLIPFKIGRGKKSTRTRKTFLLSLYTSTVGISLYTFVQCTYHR